jgi:flagellar hook-associated protein 2
MANGIDLGISGLATGFDWKSFISQMAQAERAPESRLYSEQNKLQQRNNAFSSIKTQLGILQTRITALKNPTLFDSRTAQVSDTTLGSAAASAGAATGTFVFNVTQRATAARINGTNNVGAAICPSGNPASVTLATAGFSTAVSAGTFTVNGKQITLATTDTLQDVFGKINTATSSHVTASYDATADKFTLAADSGEVVLGSASDTSNFLQVARLSNNGTGSVTSSTALGGVRLGSALASANFGTAISDGGSGAGMFKINGVSINYNASSDSVNAVLTRINNSAAGVTATYDSQNDRFVLANKTTGDVGVAMEDVTGNFLAATGISSGTLQRGQNLIYTANGSDPLTSQSNTITEASSGITGLSVTAIKEGTMTVTVNNDASKIKTAVKDFIEAFNAAQSIIDTQTASTTSSTGVVSSGILANDPDADDISSRLRSLVFSPLSGMTGVFKHLADLGIQTSGNDDKLTLDDETKLDTAIASNLASVKEIFSSSTNGIGVKLADYLDKTIGEEGTLISHQNTLTKQSTDIDTQITEMEKRIAADSDRMTTQFVAMEQAQAKMTQQLSFLSSQLK